MYAPLFRNPRKESGNMKKFCAVVWNKNLLLAVSRIQIKGESNLLKPPTPLLHALDPSLFT